MSEDKQSVESLQFSATPIHELSDEECALRIESDYEDAKAAKNTSYDRYSRYQAIYQALNPPEEDDESDSGLIEDDLARHADSYMPIGAAVVDSAASQLYNAFFSTKDYVEIESDDWEDGFFEIEVTAHQKKRHREMHLRNTLYRVLQEACCFDFGVTLTRWKLEGGFIQKPHAEEIMSNLGGAMFKKRHVKAETMWVPDKVDRSDCQVLHFSNCYPDPSATNDLDDAAFFIDVRDEKIEDLIAGSELAGPWGKYKNIDSIIRELAKNDGLADEIKGFTTVEAQRNYLKNRRLPVIRYWTKNHMAEYCAGHIIRRMNMLGWVIHLWRIFEVPGQLPGMGFLQRLERQQYDINASLNSRRDYQNLISDPFGVISRDLAQQIGGSPRLSHGQLLVSGSGDPSKQVWVYQPGTPPSQDPLLDVQLHTNMIEKQSGITENSMGAVSSGRRSATEVNKVSMAGDSRMLTIASRLEEECLEPLYLNLFYLEQANLSRTEWFKYAGQYGEKMIQISPASYMWNSVPRFVAKGAISMANDPVETQQFLAAVDRAMTMPQVQFDWQNIAVEIFRRLAPQNYTKFVKDPTVSDHNVPPSIENMLIAQGRQVEISRLNNHQEHLAAHNKLKYSMDYQVWPERMRMILDQHIDDHQKIGMAVPTRSNALGQADGMQGPADMMRGIRPPGLGVTQ